MDVVDYTCIKTVREFRKFILGLKFLPIFGTPHHFITNEFAQFLGNIIIRLIRVNMVHNK